MALAKPEPSDVLAITGPVLPAHVVQGIIDDAALMAERCISQYEADRQKAILKWLAAHLVASTNDGATMSSSKLGDAQDAWSRASLGDGLKGTVYGQQVLLLDTCGCMSRLGKPRASIEKI